VGSLNDYQKERQFRLLNQKKEVRGVKVIRDGVEHIIDVKASAYPFPILYPFLLTISGPLVSVLGSRSWGHRSA
jgi:hypothetical protein